jgi:hypothetical protein
MYMYLIYTCISWPRMLINMHILWTKIGFILNKISKMQCYLCNEENEKLSSSSLCFLLTIMFILIIFLCINWSPNIVNFNNVMWDLSHQLFVMNKSWKKMFSICTKYNLNKSPTFEGVCQWTFTTHIGQNKFKNVSLK